MKHSMEAIELPLIVKYLAPILTFLFSSALTLGFPLPACATDWETFSPPTMEYTISLPVGISKIAKEDGMDAVFYSSSDGDINFLIDDGSELNPFGLGEHEQFTREVTDGVTEKLKSEGAQNVTTEVNEISGRGWHGKKTAVNVDGTQKITLVVAVSKKHDVAYTLMATAGDDDPKVANFLKSLTVEPTVATEAHKKKSAANKIGTNLARFTVVFIVLGLFVGVPALVWLIVSVIKRRTRNLD